MLVLESVPIYGSPDQIVENPPDVILELFDWDRVVKHCIHIQMIFARNFHLDKTFNIQSSKIPLNPDVLYSTVFVLQGKKEFLGRVQVEPIVLQADSEKSQTELSWLGVYKDSCKCGDVLAAFELYLVSIQ